MFEKSATPAANEESVSPSLQGRAAFERVEPRSGGLAPLTDNRCKPVFAREQLTDTLILEMGPLLREHYVEIAHYLDIELDPDWNAYYAMQANGAVRIYTARAEDHLLIGYNCFFVRHNPHYRRSLQAVNDVIFISKERRGFGLDFIVWCDEQLRAEGVQVAYHHIKFAHDWSAMLERIGYEKQDKIMSRRLDR